MNELYFLGWLANGFFTLRFIDQWLLSERRGESLVPKRFWFFSLTGNLLMALHGAIQLQYPIFLSQVGNGFIAYRNLRLGQSSWKRIAVQMLLLFLVATTLYLTSSQLRQGAFVWTRSPLRWGSEASIAWHCVGALAIGLFSTRFWVQWWYAERTGRAAMPRAFWWMSVIGSTAAICYFSRIGDPVSLFGYGVGLIPYWRNLVLLRRS